MADQATARAVDVPELARQVEGRRANGGSLGRVRGVVLAGVHAWGECVLERAVTRPLLPVALRPLIWHALNWASEGGIREASICGNSDTTILRGRLGTGEAFNMFLDYCEDVMPRGPAGCVRDACLETDAETIVVVDGTIVPRLDLAALLAAHADARAAVTLAVGDTGFAENRLGRGLEPLGIYVFARSVLERVPATGYQDIKEALIPLLYRSGERVVAHAVPARLAPRVTDAATYLGINMWTLERMALEGAVPEGYEQRGDAWVHTSARVDASARFVGPTLVGARSEVAAGAMIVGPTTIGVDCTIGGGTVITRSAIWDRCDIGAEAVLDQCVITDDVQVEAELVARETVYLTPQRSDRGLLNRLATYCRPAPRRPVAASDVEPQPEPLPSRAL